MLTRPISAGLTQTSRRSLHALRRPPCVLLDALPEAFANLAVQRDKGRADIAAGAALGHQGKCRFARLALDAEEIELVGAVGP